MPLFSERVIRLKRLKFTGYCVGVNEVVEERASYLSLRGPCGTQLARGGVQWYLDLNRGGRYGCAVRSVQCEDYEGASNLCIDTDVGVPPTQPIVGLWIRPACANTLPRVVSGENISLRSAHIGYALGGKCAFRERTGATGSMRVQPTRLRGIQDFLGRGAPASGATPTYAQRRWDCFQGPFDGPYEASVAVRALGLSERLSGRDRMPAGFVEGSDRSIVRV